MTTPEEIQLVPRHELSFNRESFSDETLEVLDRYTEGDPNVEVVMMNDGKAVKIGPEENEERVILTLGLKGCYGTGIFVELEDGTRHCAVTHYDNSSIGRNLDKIHELIEGKGLKDSAVIKVAVVISGIGEYSTDDEGLVTGFVPRGQTKKDAAILETAIKNELGDDIEVKIEPYHESSYEGAKDEGLLMFRMPPKGKGEVQYKPDILDLKNLTSTESD